MPFLALNGVGVVVNVTTDDKIGDTEVQPEVGEKVQLTKIPRG